ncbi:MAG TPA: type II toxin-antitoxin system HicB family antitoxin [Solirubrobacterales bacterium]|nr:type II toxin-antitoxin system HicB family antitoxin [Solirubrobacterales bacterium]
MPVAETVGNTVYPRSMAKVMISLPDELLKRIDNYVRERGETRSGFLRRLAEREVENSETERRRHIEDLMEKIGTVDLGGEAARLIREDRESH